MQILKSYKSNILIEFTVYELIILKNVVNQTFIGIPKRSFSTRMGYSNEDVKILFSYINESLPIHIQDENMIQIDLSNDDLCILTQALNEVCNGFRTDQFREKIGIEREQLKSFLEVFFKWRNDQRNTPLQDEGLSNHKKYPRS